MDTYLMMLYVSLDQERAMKKLFLDNGWKYLKPDMLQLTSQLGGMVAKSMTEDSNNCKNTRVTSPAGPKVTRLKTVPSRPATRSQKARSHKSKILNVPPVRETRSKMKSTVDTKTVTSSTEQNVTLTKDKPGELVDDDDLKDYMEYGDEDDDYDDDNENKEVKKKSRRLTRNSDGDEDMIDEDIIAKLDGTEDIVPKNEQMVCSDEEINIDDEGDESNTDNLASLESQLTDDQNVIVKTEEPVDTLEKKGKKGKNQGSYGPVQYQCGLCKVRFLNKKELNKHLGDKVCKGEVEEETAGRNVELSTVRDETGEGFGDVLVEETNKIEEFFEFEGSEETDMEKDGVGCNSDSNKGGTEIGNKSKKNLYQCDQCELAYKTPFNLKTHQVMKHRMTFDESFECNECHLSYGSEHILDLHKKDKHPTSGDPADRVQCEDCEEWCDDFKSYISHKKRRHNIIVCSEVNRNHVCNTCGKAFTRSDSLKNHCDIIHLGTKKRKQKPRPTERKYVCDFCGKAFLRQNNLSEHINVKHKNTARKYKCQECGEAFLRPYSLEYHTNKIHLNKKPYECDKCHKMYFSRINLRQHQDHCYKEEEQKEGCPYCDKRFCHKRNLSMHIEAIHSKSPLTCECGFVVKWRSSIAKHRRRCRLYGNEQIVNKLPQGEPITTVKNEYPESLDSSDKTSDVLASQVSDPKENVDSGFTTISTDAGMQVISNEIAQALRDQGLLIDGAVAGTLRMEEGRTVVEEDPSVQSVYYVIMKEANICVMEDDTVNSSDNDSDSTDAVKNEGFSSDLLVSESEAGINGPGKAESTDWFKRKKYQSDAWCLEKRQGKLSVQSLKHAKPIRIKVETDKVDESQNVYGCDDCGKVYSQRSSWKRHLKSHQPGVQNCGPCSMYFDTAELLELHNRRSHSSSFSCTVCGVSMIRKSCLRKHMLKVHPEKCIAKFSCPRSPCKAVFDSEELYEDHLNIHDGKRPYSCPMCNKTFASRSSLKLHKNCHSSARFAQCKDCGKTFQSQGALHNHKVSVHQKKRFKCEKCDKVFIYRSGYCKHLLSHKKEKTGSKSQTAPVVGDLKCYDVKVENVADSKASHGPVEFLSSGSCTKTTGQNQENLSKPNQMESESSLVESTNQVEPTAGEITPVGVPSLQTSVITGQDITGLPLTTLQIDGQVMWLYRT